MHTMYIIAVFWLYVLQQHKMQFKLNVKRTFKNHTNIEAVWKEGRLLFDQFVNLFVYIELNHFGTPREIDANDVKSSMNLSKLLQLYKSVIMYYLYYYIHLQKREIESGEEKKFLIYSGCFMDLYIVAMTICNVGNL